MESSGQNKNMKSKCCLAPMRVEGKTTKYYVCENCAKPCDPAPAACFGDYDPGSEFCRKVCKYSEDCIKIKEKTA